MFRHLKTVVLIAAVAALIPFAAEFFGIGYDWGAGQESKDASASQGDAGGDVSAIADDDGVKGTQPPTDLGQPTSFLSLQPSLSLCPRLRVSNAPATTGSDRAVAGYRPVVSVNGVKLAVVPTDYSCLSSGFGTRNGKLHAGVDFQGRPPGMVYAGGAGLIKEAGYRDDFGYYVLIDHGFGVFTRYAHLRALSPGATVGGNVTMGTPLGRMGNTASYRIPVHLHYELLIGDYNTQARSFGLTPRNIFDYL